MVPILTAGVTFWWPTGELLLRGDGSLKPAGRSERDDCVPPILSAAARSRTSHQPPRQA